MRRREFTALFSSHCHYLTAISGPARHAHAKQEALAKRIDGSTGFWYSKDSLTTGPRSFNTTSGN